jgi:hypothetical protein
VADGRMYESKRRSNIRLAAAGGTDGAEGLAAPASPSAV